ncbi:MAG TPA: hypothetical protein PLP06_11025 [Saprospiraceae bacterium]|nr:hypothetical protein [Saprospiraceae bacterium]
MHDLEPYYQWRDYYISEEDKRSPFFRRDYNEFHFTNKVYNYFIHPQWDDFGSSTLYLKLLYVDYDDGYAIIELIGEWNDALHNDIMFFKRDIADHLMQEGISKFILIGENVLNFHNSDDDYYAEWYDDLQEVDGWVVCLGLLPHVIEEMNRLRLFHYFFYGLRWNSINWRSFTPQDLYSQVEEYVDKPKLLPG